MLRRFCFLLAAFGAVQAQQPVAPTTETVGDPRGSTLGNYNITNSVEFGYRWSLVGGDLGNYRTDVNYRNGVRVLGSNLAVESKDGHGHFFDEILLSTIGLGNDPYQSATLRIQKNRLYRYDMLWRLDEYYNPGLTVSGGLHLMDTRRRLQDHDITLLPQSRFQINLGYSRNDQTGPALSSIQEFDTLSAAFPVFTNVKREWNEYRIGFSAEFSGFKLTARRNWDFFKDDTGYSFSGAEGSGIPGDPTVLNQFVRSEPNHGSNPGWLGNLYGSKKYWAVNARLSYVSGNNDFILNELALGTNRFSSAINRQIVVTGNAQRPVIVGDFDVNFLPTEHLTIVNHTSVHNTRIDGNSFFTQYDFSSGMATTLNFHFLGVRTISNATDVNYRFNDWLGAYVGYTYSDRQIRDVEDFVIPSVAGTASNSLYEQESHLNAGRVGVRVHPLKPLTINLESELGHSDHPLATASERNYHTLGGRIQYRTRKLQLGTGYRELYNQNAPLSFLTFSSRSRTYNATASWAPNDRFTFDASYSKLHLDSVGGLAFFAGVTTPQLQTGFNSIYISNIHAANVGARIVLQRRADLYVGYSITKDTGDGRGAAVPSGVSNPVEALLDSVQTFPLTYQSPMARLSIRISPKIRWNAGWQFYNYGEQFHLFSYNQNYHAHTGYTSLLWSF